MAENDSNLSANQYQALEGMTASSNVTGNALIDRLIQVLMTNSRMAPNMQPGQDL